MIDKAARYSAPLSEYLTEYTERNTNNEYSPVAVGRYGIRARESIYSKELAADYSKNKLIYPNTLTVGMGSVQMDIGILTDDVIYSVSPAYHTYRINGICSEYLGYCLKYRNQDMFSQFSKRGSRQGKSIDLRRWLTYKIPVYDVKEQNEIVSILKKAEEIIEKYSLQLSALDELIKARFIEMFGDPIKNPKGWDKVPLSELAEIKIGPFGSLLHKEDYCEGGHALVNPSHIVHGKICIDEKMTIDEQKYSDLSAYHLIKGDVVMGRRGEMGRCAVVEVDGLLCGTGSLLIRVNDNIKADYIQRIISFPSFKKTIEDMAVGQTMQNLNVPIVANFHIIKPPLEVQENYYSFVAQVDKSKVVVQKATKNYLCML
jgi:restriction endonuclease S subunit